VIEEPYGPPAPPKELPPHELREIPMPKQFVRVHEETGNVTGFFMQVDQPDATDDSFFVVVEPPFSMATNPRASRSQVLRYRGGSVLVWEEEATIDQKREGRIEAMRVACETQITAGFMCSALGQEYLYPAKTQDQANLIASVTDSLMAGSDPDWRTQFWCADAGGAWEFRDHTVDQIQQVGKTGKAAILMAMGKNELLRRQIDAAKTVAEIEAITW
jgi:hypothetical protein